MLEHITNDAWLRDYWKCLTMLVPDPYAVDVSWETRLVAIEYANQAWAKQDT